LLLLQGVLLRGSNKACFKGNLWLAAQRRGREHFAVCIHLPVNSLTAIEAGTAVENVSYMGSGSSIYRAGSTFMTVSKDGVIRSIVTNAQAGWGVVKAYYDAGGR
jgi:hypothetical protein